MSDADTPTDAWPNPETREWFIRHTQEQIDQREAATKWLETHWTARNKKCPICESNDWEVSSLVMLEGYELPPIRPTGTSGTTLWGLFFVTCKTCAFTYTFDAVRAGLPPWNDLPPFPPGVMGDEQ